MSERVNKVIEILDQGQPVYCTHAQDISFEGGKEIAQTWADWVRIKMDHTSFDMPNLEAFMKGLVAGGPTKSGHLTPTVTVELPFGGYSEAVVRANAWMIQQVLGLGVHGIILNHAETPKAVGAFVESCRYPFQTNGIEVGLGRGQRGGGGAVFASPIWGLSVRSYQEKADVWPLNPKGEIILGIKIETRQSVPMAKKLTRVPGLCFAEWGPTDMTLSFGYLDSSHLPYPEEVSVARGKVVEASLKAGLYFLNSVNAENVKDRIDEGIMMCDPWSETPEVVASIGKEYTQRENKE